ncbi:hypothetical protein [Desulforhopalus sp. IMCC35007]|uniref:hypothetical protein n=1 Tax=Desulforhopalus sp. IMCC35007 TaxID=2569543 RepID=UPI0010AED146|nr:hypothetical protein [Desulforhopalus sp. IMCC35007]TKB11606.1 hypothetical protein FCL48_02055 [Desulforhopalus sp. IMCC35007]
MNLTLHIAQSLDRQMDKLIHSSRISEQAVYRFLQLLEDIRKYGVHGEKVLIKRTRNGEQRIKNCVKYDLGGGFRLVTVMIGDNLFVPFLGSHDETDQWLDRHKADDFVVDNAVYRSEQVVLADNEENDVLSEAEELDDTDTYERQLEAKLDETILLSIFQGLNRNRKDTVHEGVQS